MNESVIWHIYLDVVKESNPGLICALIHGHLRYAWARACRLMAVLLSAHSHNSILPLGQVGHSQPGVRLAALPHG